VDAAEISGIEHMLRADTTTGRRAKIRLENSQHRLEHRHARQTHRRAALVYLPSKVLVDDGVEDDAGFLIDFGEDLLELLFRADKRIDMLDRSCVLVLRRCGTTSRQQRLACRVGNQVQMEKALLLLHRIGSRSVET